MTSVLLGLLLKPRKGTEVFKGTGLVLWVKSRFTVLPHFLCVWNWCCMEHTWLSSEWMEKTTAVLLTEWPQARLQNWWNAPPINCWANTCYKPTGNICRDRTICWAIKQALVNWSHAVCSLTPGELNEQWMQKDLVTSKCLVIKYSHWKSPLGQHEITCKLKVPVAIVRSELDGGSYEGCRRFLGDHCSAGVGQKVERRRHELIQLFWIKLVRFLTDTHTHIHTNICTQLYWEITPQLEQDKPEREPASSW